MTEDKRVDTDELRCVAGLLDEHKYESDRDDVNAAADELDRLRQENEVLRNGALEMGFKASADIQRLEEECAELAAYSRQVRNALEVCANWHTCGAEDSDIIDAALDAPFPAPEHGKTDSGDGARQENNDDKG